MAAPTLPLPWVKLNEIYYTPSASRLYRDNAVYVFLQGPFLSGPQAQLTWHPYDLRPFGVAGDATWALLSGMTIVTHGTTDETADGYIVFRKPGDNTVQPDEFIGQTVEAHIGGGQRSGVTTGVALTDGQGELAFHTTTPGVWPAHSAYGFNFSVQMWGR